MEEVVLERLRKEREDKQWEEYHKTEGNGEAQPTQRQKSYVLSLARNIGMKVDVSKIESREKAAVLIERLKLLNRRMNGNGYDYELRDRKVAFGMATKLVFRQYLDQQKDPRKWKQFWKDVHAFYEAYEQEQELAVMHNARQGI